MKVVTRPRIGPCRDPLHLWFLEWADDRGIWRRYYANRDEARRALTAHRQGTTTATTLMRVGTRAAG